jgi:hypothetical protein
MHDLSCDEVRDAAAEFALDIISPDEKAAVAAHLVDCPACREDVGGMQESASRLLDLVPGTEPPLGFDRRVLARAGYELKPGRRRFRLVVTLAAAALLVIGSTFGAELGRTSTHAPRQVVASASFYQGSVSVGEVYVYAGRPPWVQMTVRGLQVKGPVACEIVGPTGAVTKVGSFELVGGGGYWGAPVESGLAQLNSVDLVDVSGHVIASAVFS